MAVEQGDDAKGDVEGGDEVEDEGWWRGARGWGRSEEGVLDLGLGL